MKLGKELGRLPQIVNNHYLAMGEREKRRPNRTSIRTLSFNHLDLKMGWSTFRSLSFPLFRYIRRQHTSAQRFRPFTMSAAETQTVNTTHRLRALRELMAQEKHDVNAVIIPSEDQRMLQPNHTWRQSMTF